MASRCPGRGGPDAGAGEAGGRSPLQAMAMLVPEAYEGNPTMDSRLRAFYEYQRTLPPVVGSPSSGRPAYASKARATMMCGCTTTLVLMVASNASRNTCMRSVNGDARSLCRLPPHKGH